MVDRLTIVTPWYPSSAQPFGGSFVRTQAMAVRDRVDRLDVLHLDTWSLPVGSRAQKAVSRATKSMLQHDRTRARAIERDEGSVTRVPSPVLPQGDYGDSALRAVDTLTAMLPGGRIEADVVHAHVGLPAGLVAVRCARSGATVVVTEHASFLDRMLKTGLGKQLYDEVLERCSVFVCVSELLREQLLETFAHHANKVVVVPNVVPLEDVPTRPSPVTELRRWLYVGSFRQPKGVLRVLEAFALCHDENPDLRLTMVGGGPQYDELIERAGQLNVAEAVEIRGPVQPDAVYDLYHGHDLLVHASRYETFGMTIIEAIAAGMPVLVTRCGGPEETLAGLEGIAGHLIDVGEGPTELVRGFRTLVAGFDELDLYHARSVLTDRYGARAVGSRLLELYRTSGARP